MGTEDALDIFRNGKANERTYFVLHRWLVCVIWIIYRSLLFRDHSDSSCIRALVYHVCLLLLERMFFSPIWFLTAVIGYGMRSSSLRERQWKSFPQHQTTGWLQSGPPLTLLIPWQGLATISSNVLTSSQSPEISNWQLMASTNKSNQDL